MYRVASPGRALGLGRATPWWLDRVLALLLFVPLLK
jgi:hypothetical protein